MQDYFGRTMLENFNKQSRIFVAGHNGLVGSAVLRLLQEKGFENIIVKSRQQLDLTLKKDVQDFFIHYQPQYVFNCAAKVGGINHNLLFPADYIRDNILIQTHLIDSAARSGVKKYCFLGSAACYPSSAISPISESQFLNGPPDEANEAYATAKQLGFMLNKKYREQFNFDAITVIPNNVYGINDNFRDTEAHVVPSLIKKILVAAENSENFVKLHGDGSPVRDFIYSDDLASSLLFLMENYSSHNVINVSGEETISIKDLAHLIANIIGYKGKIIWDCNFPSGKSYRTLDISAIKKMGWSSKYDLKEGLFKTISWVREKGSNNVRI